MIQRTLFAFLIFSLGTEAATSWMPLPLRDSVVAVQPMTGIVLWADNDSNATSAVALEYSYMSFADLSPADGVWNWKPVDSLLDRIASRHHQAILRFRYEYVGMATTVPSWIQAKSGYQETVGKSEGLDTWFADWRSPDLLRFSLDFHQAFAERYQDDPRLAFVQVGFGLWAEYHIYEGPMILGRTFPSKAFQATFLRHLDTVYRRLPWSISIDAAGDWAPFDSLPELVNLGFGLFDDSFLHQTHDAENRPNWLRFGETRWKRKPAGGEFSYYSTFDQKNVLDSAGIYGRTFESQVARYGISYMIGNDQPEYHTMGRIQQASKACGYRFRATAWEVSSDSFRLGLTNIGAAPLYRDAFVVLGDDTAKISLKGLAPGEALSVSFTRKGRSTDQVRPSIACGHCVVGQRVGLEADLSGATGDFRTGSSASKVEWRLGSGGWLYRSDRRRPFQVFGLEGRVAWSGELASTEGAWRAMPLGFGQTFPIRTLLIR